MTQSESYGGAAQAPDAGARRAQFAQLIEALDTQATQLLGILQREREALASSQAEQVTTTATEKRNALAALDTLELARIQLCGEHNPSDRSQAMAAQLNALPDPGTLLARWQAVLEVLGKCKALNSANGRLLEHQHHRITDTLTLLRNGVSHKRLYGPDGVTAEHTPAAPLASA